MNFKNHSREQMSAVKHEDGPLLLISGAGTGKTHVLTGRILHLIQERGVAPENILALTFTEHAANEMLERVDSALPLGSAPVCIKTFHGFCDSVLRERAFEIGLSTDYTMLTDVDLWMFLKQHVMDFKLEYYRALGNPHKFLNSLAEYFSRLQDEAVFPEAYEKYAAGLSATASDDEEKELAARHTELAAAYVTYQRLLSENNRADFASLVSNTLRLFEKRKSILAEYQKRFQYILVDEFQDTNFAQTKLVSLLASAHKNLFVVGDDDQSIYKWRGASLNNINFFRAKFPEAKTLVLRENYRSMQSILDTAYSLIQHNNPDRLEVKEKIDKKLLATRESAGTPPQIYHFETVQEEVALVVSQARALVKAGKNVAVLVRTNALAKPFIEAFNAASIPLQHWSPSRLFSKPAIKDCIAVLRVIADPWDDIGLFRLLSIPHFEMPMEKLLELLRLVKMRHVAFFTLLLSPATVSFPRKLESVDRFPVVAGNDKKSDDIKKLLDHLIEASRKQPASQILGMFLEESGYMKRLENSEDLSGQLTDIAEFSEKVSAFEQTHAHTSVRDLLDYLALFEEVGEPRDAADSVDPGCVKVLTIHGSKGLEFDAVFIPGLVAGKFPSIGRKEAFEIPTELLPEPVPENAHLGEERRLMYVACTRARDSLVLTYSDFYDGVKQWKPSPFVAELSQESMFHEMSKGRKKKADAKAAQQTLLSDERQPRSLRLNLPKLSFSQLDTFRTCPLKYQFRYLWNMPSPPSAALSFGISIHNTLRDFYTFLQQNPAKRSEDLRRPLAEFYENNWIASGYESRALLEDQKKRGQLLLEKVYVAEQKKSLPVPAFIEKSFTLELEGVKISGRIDRIDQLPDGTYEVVDYKTGTNPEKSLKKDLQLSIYALACRDVLKIPVSSLSLYYLDTVEKITTTRTEKELENCREEIIEAAKELASSDFAATPGFHCGWCEYRFICPSAQ